MSNVEESIDVDVPVRTAYDQWTQFEQFPQFMEGVQRIDQLDDTHVHWVVTVAGKTTEWDAEITEQHPDHRIAWTSTDGKPNAGVVTFHQLAPDKTRIMVQMDYDTEGVVETVGDKLGFAKRRLSGDLGRFKDLIEGRGVASGAWRGEVENANDEGLAPTSVPPKSEGEEEGGGISAKTLIGGAAAVAAGVAAAAVLKGGSGGGSSEAEESIEVNVPVRAAYNQWTQFEQFPQFMEGVERVDQLDDKRLHWVVSVAGKTTEWDAEITEQQPDQRIAWQSIGGKPNSGLITFEPTSADRTRVTVRMAYDPEGVVETVGDKLGFAQRRLSGDLGRFKELIESRGFESGAWRGQIEGGVQQTPGTTGL
jgi:uncharacterized membrane protein